MACGLWAGLTGRLVDNGSRTAAGNAATGWRMRQLHVLVRGVCRVQVLSSCIRSALACSGKLELITLSHVPCAIRSLRSLMGKVNVSQGGCACFCGNAESCNMIVT